MRTHFLGGANLPLRCLFVDMNSYFASVEQQDDPRLRGQPVAVAAVNVPSTACIAASYEAKALGIRTGTPVREARLICPHIAIREARPQRYVEVHHQIVEAVTCCLPVEAVDSIDEMWGKLDLRQQNRAAAVRLAREVKASIADRIGRFIPCSVGVAPNRFLAKVATDLHKPDGLTVIEPHDLPDALLPLELLDLPGIGRGMSRRLRRFGITTVQRLYEADAPTLRMVWGGVVGERWWHWLRGDEVELPRSRRASVGHSHVLAPENRTPERAKAVFIRLIHKAAARLRYLGLGASRVNFYISYTWREEGWAINVNLTLTQSTRAVIEEFLGIWPRRLGGVPKHLAVTFLRLEPWRGATPSLPFDKTVRPELDRVVDAINDRCGSGTIYPAGLMGVEDSAPTRISFTHIPVFTGSYEG